MELFSKKHIPSSNNNQRQVTILTLPNIEIDRKNPNYDELKLNLKQFETKAKESGINNEIIESVEKILTFKNNSPAFNVSLHNLKYLTLESLKSFENKENKSEERNNYSSKSYLMQLVDKTYCFFKDIGKSVYNSITSAISTVKDIVLNFFTSSKVESIKDDKIKSIFQTSVDPNIDCSKNYSKNSDDEKKLYHELINRIDTFFHLNKPYLSRNILDYKDPRDGLTNNQPKILKEKHS